MNEQFDKQFRDLIQNDDADLNQAEQEAKQRIWSSLKPPKSANVWRWKLAVGILLLLFGMMLYLWQNEVMQQRKENQELQQALIETKNALAQATLDQQQLQQQIKVPAPLTVAPTIESTTIIEYRDKYVDRIIEKRDTLLVEKQLLSPPITIVTRDTIIVRDTVWLQRPRAIANANDSSQKSPTGVEFIFGEKPADQKYKIPIYISNRAVAKKPTNNSQGIIKVTIN